MVNAARRCPDYEAMTTAEAATRDDIAELFQNQRSSIEVDLEDGRRGGLRGRNPGGVDDADDIANRRGGFH